MTMHGHTYCHESQWLKWRISNVWSFFSSVETVIFFFFSFILLSFLPFTPFSSIAPLKRNVFVYGCARLRVCVGDVMTSFAKSHFLGHSFSVERIHSEDWWRTSINGRQPNETWPNGRQPEEHLDSLEDSAQKNEWNKIFIPISWARWREAKSFCTGTRRHQRVSPSAN